MRNLLIGKRAVDLLYIVNYLLLGQVLLLLALAVNAINNTLLAGFLSSSIGARKATNR